MNTKTIATYTTSRGNIALEVIRHTDHKGNMTYSYNGKHGAGSGHALEHVQDTIRVMMATHKGIRLTSGWDIMNEPAPVVAPAEPATSCPSCSAPVTGSVWCPSCGFQLKGAAENAWRPEPAPSVKSVQTSPEGVACVPADWLALASRVDSEGVRVDFGPESIPVIVARIFGGTHQEKLAVADLIVDSCFRARSHAAHLAKIKALEKANTALWNALNLMVYAYENADETGYVTDVGFMDMDKLCESARAALALPSA